MEEDDITKLLKAESLCLDNSSDSKLTPLEAVLQVKQTMNKVLLEWIPIVNFRCFN